MWLGLYLSLERLSVKEWNVWVVTNLFLGKDQFVTCTPHSSSQDMNVVWMRHTQKVSVFLSFTNRRTNWGVGYSDPQKHFWPAQHNVLQGKRDPQPNRLAKKSMYCISIIKRKRWGKSQPKLQINILLLRSKFMKEYHLFYHVGALKKQTHIPSWLLTRSLTTPPLDNSSRAYQLFFKGWPADTALRSSTEL